MKADNSAMFKLATAVVIGLCAGFILGQYRPSVVHEIPVMYPVECTLSEDTPKGVVIYQADTNGDCITEFVSPTQG